MRLVTVFMMFLLLFACSKKEEPAGGPFTVPDDAIETDTGLKYVILEDADGPAARSGQTVVVHYTGWLMDGKKFDSSVDKNRPFEFPLGAGSVIKGWDEGVAGMKTGEKRRLFIPSDLGYGPNGYPPVIPENAMLVFDVELLEIK